MDEDEKSELDDDIIKLKSEVIILRAFVKTLFLINISMFEKTYGTSHEKAEEFFYKILERHLSQETDRAYIDSAFLDNEIRSLFEDD